MSTEQPWSPSSCMHQTHGQCTADTSNPWRDITNVALAKFYKILWQVRRTNMNVLSQADIPSIEALAALDRLRCVGHIVRRHNKILLKQVLDSVPQ